MRPVAVPDAFQGRSRKSSLADNQASNTWADPRTTTPTTFFLARESEVDKDNADSPQRESGSRYGVQSLAETVGEAGATFVDGDTDDPTTLSRRRSTIKSKKPAEHTRDRSSSAGASNVPPPTDAPSPRPLTPLFLTSPGDPSSTPSSPKSLSTRSLRHSEDESGIDDTNSQAITSGGEDEDEREQALEPDTVAGLQDSAPQLIMPSIKMPSRRPFTGRGKDIGRFKILLAGSKRSGKTSLIKSIVQICEDIVHVDPLSPSLPKPGPSRPKLSRSKSSMESSCTTLITEIYASTRPYPGWWSDLDESRVLKRRKSMGDSVLERNLCFVDTPGAVQAEVLIQYVEQQFAKALAAVNTATNDVVGLLTGSGGSQVDAVLYVLSQDTLSSDFEVIERLSNLTNVIPIIGKADTLSKDVVDNIKVQSLAKVQDHLPRPFHPFDRTFNAPDSPDSGDVADRVHAPYAVSSTTTTDPETMDASLLMSPDYVQPLLASELAYLVQRIFDSNTISWLRHTAAKKLVQHCRTQQNHLRMYNSSSTIPLSPSGGASTPYSFLQSPISSPSNSQVLVSYSAAMMNPPPLSQNYNLARLADHTQREERFAQIRLAKWATDLQQSLRNERERYEKLARGERAVWLTEKLGECVAEGTLIPISQSAHSSSDSTELDLKQSELVRFAPRPSLSMFANQSDPLGILRWNDMFRQRGWAAVQLVTGFGLVGAVAWWIAKHWEGFGFGLERTWSWNKLVGGDSW